MLAFLEKDVDKIINLFKKICDFIRFIYIPSLNKVDAIDLKNRLPPKERWSKMKIGVYWLYLKIRLRGIPLLGRIRAVASSVKSLFSSL